MGLAACRPSLAGRNQKVAEIPSCQWGKSTARMPNFPQATARGGDRGRRVLVTKSSRVTWTAVAIALLGLTRARALAHCDGLDGPVVKAAQRALETRKGVNAPAADAGRSVPTPAIAKWRS
jgi:hypothetical protein